MKCSCKRLIAPVVAAGLVTASLAAHADDPVQQPDESWLTVNGTVVSAKPDSFKLDYGEGLVTVEMDGWGWYEDDHLLIEGDQVTVHGRVDDSLFEKGTIEAGSVYVEDLNTYFYANTADEEADARLISYVVTAAPDEGSWVNISGIIEEVDGREFTLTTGFGEIDVDTRTMTYNPLDDEGFQRLDRGQAVAVRGRLDNDLFERREIVADTIYSLSADAAKEAKKTEKGY
ncbi:MAG: DUF5666 domain-containing protein [Gammaproteobacteria bacterium]|nr:DUF5666 domain-containing protein [Gammaproteobacteria bacterium]